MRSAKMSSSCPCCWRSPPAFRRRRFRGSPAPAATSICSDDLAPLVDGRIAEFITDLDIPTDPRAALRARHPILKRHFDLIIDTQRYLGRTLFLRRIPHRRFISGTWRYFFQAAPPRGLSRRPPRLSDKLLGLAAAAAGCEIPVPNPIPMPPGLRARAAELLPAGASYIGFAPGAGVKHTGKCWPIDGFIALAQQHAACGHVPVFFLGPAERAWSERLREAVPEALFPEQHIDPAGAPETSGPSLVTALAERLSAAVANCSGTGHLLAAGERRWCRSTGQPDRKNTRPLRRADLHQGAGFRVREHRGHPVRAPSPPHSSGRWRSAPPQRECPPSHRRAQRPLPAPISVGRIARQNHHSRNQGPAHHRPVRHKNVVARIRLLNGVRRGIAMRRRKWRRCVTNWRNVNRPALGHRG